VGSVALLAACAPPPQAPSGETSETGEQVPSQAAQKLIVNAYVPTEWTERSSEHPTVQNAPRILAEKWKEHEPNVEIEWMEYTGSPSGEAGDTYYGSWLTALISAGNEPDIIWPLHEIPIQNGYCLPIDDYLAQPSPYASQYKTWKDGFYPTVMNSLIFGDGKTYCAPVQQKLGGFEVGLMCNMEWFSKLGLTPPASWTEQMEVSKALKEAGAGWSPWPPEAKEGNIWCLGLQLLPSYLQDVGAQMDTNGDGFVNAEEALAAFRAGIIGAQTEKYKEAWLEQKKAGSYWTDGWSTADLEVMWRNGQIGYRQTGGWEFTAQKSDPMIKFERVLVPPPYVISSDHPEANDPPKWTAGDGKIPAEIFTAINGPDTAVMKKTQERNTLDLAIKWLQWITEPQNCAFLVNENEEQLPCAIDAPLGPLWTELLQSKIPLYDYQIAWWGEGLQFDNTEFNEVRKVFVAWMTDQMDDETFFQRQQDEMTAGANRYEEAVNALKEEGQ
jgi:maltose-binding protein MalE